jgi:hypothetical protein
LLILSSNVPHYNFQRSIFRPKSNVPPDRKNTKENDSTNLIEKYRQYNQEKIEKELALKQGTNQNEEPKQGEKMTIWEKYLGMAQDPGTVLFKFQEFITILHRGNNSSI